VTEPLLLPQIVVRLEVEGSRADVEFQGITTPEDARGLGAWIVADRRRHALFLAALELAQPRPGDLADDELLETLAAALQVPPATPDPYSAICPLGSLQGKSLRYIVDRLEPALRDEWFRWALAQDWPLDRDFKRALREVAAAEGFLEPGAPDGCEEDAA
jgi:hypothetical protein